MNVLKYAGTLLASAVIACVSVVATSQVMSPTAQQVTQEGGHANQTPQSSSPSVDQEAWLTHVEEALLSKVTEASARGSPPTVEVEHLNQTTQDLQRQLDAIERRKDTQAERIRSTELLVAELRGQLASVQSTPANPRTGTDTTTVELNRLRDAQLTQVLSQAQAAMQDRFDQHKQDVNERIAQLKEAVDYVEEVAVRERQELALQVQRLTQDISTLREQVHMQQQVVQRLERDNQSLVTTLESTRSLQNQQEHRLAKQEVSQVALMATSSPREPTMHVAAEADFTPWYEWSLLGHSLGELVFTLIMVVLVVILWIRKRHREQTKKQVQQEQADVIENEQEDKGAQETSPQPREMKMHTKVRNAGLVMQVFGGKGPLGKVGQFLSKFALIAWFSEMLGFDVGDEVKSLFEDAEPGIAEADQGEPADTGIGVTPSGRLATQKPDGDWEYTESGLIVPGGERSASGRLILPTSTREVEPDCIEA